MNTFSRRGAAAILIFAMVLAAWAQGPNRRTTQAMDDSPWLALMESMEHMHSAMASVRPSGDRDTDFVKLMLPHHQAAIDMAKTQLAYGADPQMRRLAQEIITNQQSEIEVMQLWLKQHPPGSLKAHQTRATDGSKEP